MKNIFLSGSFGMVGHNILDAFNGSSYNLFHPGRTELDLLDKNAVDTYFQFHKPDIVIHCAGKVGGIHANIAEPAYFLIDNMRMGLNLAEAAQKNNIRYFLNLGSSCMYPAHSQGLLTEDMILSGSLETTNEGYAIAKCAITRLCSYISRQFSGFHYKTIIPCNLYGKYDKFDPARSHMIASIIRKIDEAIKFRIPEVEIWGDGQARREFMYAGDLAQLVRMAVENFDDLPPVMNAGIGHDYTVDEYYQIIGRLFGYKGKFTHNLSKPSGMRRKLLDVSLQLKFGFMPEHSLEAGIRETYEWYKTL